MRGNYGWFVLNLGLFMHDRSLFGVCSVKNGGFAKIYIGFAKRNILDSQKVSWLRKKVSWIRKKKPGLVDGIRKKIYPGMKNGGFAKKYPGFTNKYPGFANLDPGFTKKNIEG